MSPSSDQVGLEGTCLASGPCSVPRIRSDHSLYTRESPCVVSVPKSGWVDRGNNLSHAILRMNPCGAANINLYPTMLLFATPANPVDYYLPFVQLQRPDNDLLKHPRLHKNASTGYLSRDFDDDVISSNFPLHPLQFAESRTAER